MMSKLVILRNLERAEKLEKKLKALSNNYLNNS